MIPFAVFFAALIGFVGYTKKDLFSPFWFILLLYTTVLFIDSIHLARAQEPWSSTAIIMFYGSLLLVLLGAAIPQAQFSLVNRERSLYGSDTIRRRLADQAKQVDWKWFDMVTLFSAAVFLMTFFLTVQETGIIPALSKTPDVARITFLTHSRMIEIGWFFGPLTMMLATLGFIHERSRRILRAIVAIVVFVVYLTLVTRMDLIRFFIFSIVVFNYSVRRINLAHAGIFILSAVVLFGVMMAVRININPLSYETFSRSIGFKLGGAWLLLANPYSYLANNLWNFDYVVSKFVEGNNYYPFSMGYELLRPLLFVTNLEIPVVNAYGFDTIFNESAVKVNGLNTIVYVWHLYKDFGSFGVVVMSSLGGLLAAAFYNNFLAAPTLLKLMIWGVIIGIITLSFMWPLWTFWFVYLNIAVFVIAFKKLPKLLIS